MEGGGRLSGSVYLWLGPPLACIDKFGASSWAKAVSQLQRINIEAAADAVRKSGMELVRVGEGRPS